MRLEARVAALLLAVMAVGACAHRPVRLGASEQVQTSAGLFVLEFDPADHAGAARVREALVAAGSRLVRWGTLREPVVVQVLPNHHSLEQAVDREGYAWLRAWARREVVFVQSPPTWFEGGPTQPQVNELLLHELTHCVMYQASSPGDEWQRKRIPVWFREGMASVTADQGYRRASLPALARQLAGGTRGDPLRAPEALFRAESGSVYSAAHHAFAFLERRYGDEAIKKVLAGMHAGGNFAEAFEAGIGLAPEAFVREFRRYVLLGGWRTRPQR